jgi:hypothetical protein
MARRIAAVVLLAVLGFGSLAAARPGGGETYSRDSSSESRDTSDDVSSRDSDDDEAAAVLFAVVELCIRYPKVAVPVLLTLVGLFVLFGGLSGPDTDWERLSRELHADASPAPPVRPSLRQIEAVDPDFSSVLFQDFVFRLYATAHNFRGIEGKLDELSPYLSASARRALSERQPAHQPVTDVVIGKISIARVSVPATEDAQGDFTAFVKVGVQFEANYSVGSGPGSRRFVVEDWLLRRAANARTKPPSAERRFPCPNCGAPWRSEQAAGTQKCSFCGTVVDNGRFDWQVEEIRVRRETDHVPGLEADVPEQGTELPTVVDAGFVSDWKALTDQDPAVAEAAIAARLGFIYATLNDAWSRGDLQAARPVLSDGLADYCQYWIDAYATRGLRNVLEDMRLTRHQLVKLARDHYYDALTVRIWATGKDFVVRSADGTVVRGSRDHARDYSEYWTLIRSRSRQGAPRADNTCGSCGAPLTISMSGQCEHCGSHVTAGEFDWVLSSIEQDEAYGG